MNELILLDTGPLLSLLDMRDQHHDWVKSEFTAIKPPLLLCEAVLTEACFLAQRRLGRTDVIWRLLERGVISLAFSLDENSNDVRDLMTRYSNVPMSLADACLVRMSELIDHSKLLTFDCDFRVYRRHVRKNIPLLIPPGL